MNAVIWNAPEKMDMEWRDLPQPGYGEVVLRVLAVGICGSEIEGYLGHNSLRVPPLIMGHEFCGSVEKNGEGAGLYPIGQKVVVNPLLYCGTCDPCAKGLTQLCERRQIIGVHRPGAFAQFVAVPQSALVPVSEAINPYRASLAEPLACSLRATRRAMQRHFSPHVVVFGAGGIGLLCAKIAGMLGASSVLIADTNEKRLKVARQMGIQSTVNPVRQSLVSLVPELFGKKGADVVIDAAGFQTTREQSIQILNPGGTFMNIGLGIDETKLPINYLIRSEIEILGSFCYSRSDFLDAVRLLEQGRVTEKGWTEIRSLNSADAAFKDLVSGRVSNGKIFLNPAAEDE